MPDLTIGDVYSALGKTLNQLIRTDLIRKNGKGAYGKLTLTAIGNLRTGVSKYCVSYERRNSNQEPVAYWCENFNIMELAVKFYNEAASGELDNVDY